MTPEIERLFISWDASIVYSAPILLLPNVAFFSRRCILLDFILYVCVPSLLLLRALSGGGRLSGAKLAVTAERGVAAWQDRSLARTPAPVSCRYMTARFTSVSYALRILFFFLFFFSFVPRLPLLIERPI